MDRRTFLKHIGAAATTAGSINHSNRIWAMGQKPETRPFSKPAQKSPNVIIILSDDHRWDVMSCAGNPYLRTPHLDRLAREGAIFQNAFSTSGLCSPSRASILTGQYAFQVGASQIIWTNHTFRNQAHPFPSQLHAAGYYAIHVGKWHLGYDDKAMPGYDHWAAFEWLGESFDTTLVIDGVRTPFQGFSDDVLSQYAAEQIRRRAKYSQPFCLFLAIKSPHLPFSYPPRYQNAFDDIAIPPPSSLDEDFSKSGKLEQLRSVIDIKHFENGLPRFKTWDNYIKSYYRSCLAIDDAVGNILSALDEAKIADQTLVIYTSDQGYSLGEHGLTEKHYAYEEPMRIPLLMRYPQAIEPGTKIKEMALNIDIAPTVLDFCQVKPQSPMAGQSLKPLLTNTPKIDWRKDFLFETVSYEPIPGQVAVRTERYKLITYPWIENAPDELYDLFNDPQEMQNIAQSPEAESILLHMHDRLEQLKKQTGWRKVVPYLPNQCLLVKPLEPQQHEMVRGQILACSSLHSITTQQQVCYKWQMLSAADDRRGHFNLEAFATSESLIFAVFDIKKNVPFDPFVLAHLPTRIPLKCYVNGICYLDIDGSDDFITELKARKFNPPLLKENNILVLEMNATPSLSICIYAPQDTISVSNAVRQDACF